MCNIDVLIKAISSGQFDESFEKLYLKAEVSAQKKRYLQTLLYFKENYPESKNASIYSVPGRTEMQLQGILLQSYQKTAITS